MKKITQLVLFCATLMYFPNAYSSDTEHRIVATIDTNLSESLKLLEEAVNINSGTLNFSGVTQVGQLFRNQFQQLGLKTQWVDGNPFGRSGHLIASNESHLTAPTAPRVLLIGHLDTVFAKNDEFQKFERLNDKQITGPGITDMKGGNVIILSALRALQEVDLLDKIAIRVVMTGDEESSGTPLSAARKSLIDAAVWADIALGFEDGDGDIKTAVVARRGSVDWQLKVAGRAAHSSQIFQPQVGYGAIFEAARILDQFRTELAGKGNLTFNPGLITGGTTTSLDSTTASAAAFGKNNVVAKTVTVSGGIRALTPDELAQGKAVMQKIVENNLLHTTAELVFGDGYPPLAPSDGNLRLLSLYSQVSQDLGFGAVEAVNPRNAGAADISFTAGHVEMALDGLGLMGTGGHTRDEIADIETLAINAKKAAVLLYRLSASEH